MRRGLYRCSLKPPILFVQKLTGGRRGGGQPPVTSCVCSAKGASPPSHNPITPGPQHCRSLIRVLKVHPPHRHASYREASMSSRPPTIAQTRQNSPASLSPPPPLSCLEQQQQASTRAVVILPATPCHQCLLLTYFDNPHSLHHNSSPLSSRSRGLKVSGSLS